MISEESGESMESSPTALGLPCAEHTDADSLAACFSEFYGAQVTAEDVAGCETQSEGLAESDEITRFDELESCLFEVMFPPTLTPLAEILRLCSSKFPTLG